MNQNNSVEQQQQFNSFNRTVTNQMNQQEQIEHVQLQGHLVSVENEDPKKIEYNQERRQQFEGEQESIIIEQHDPDVARTDVGINQNFEEESNHQPLITVGKYDLFDNRDKNKNEQQQLSVLEQNNDQQISSSQIIINIQQLNQSNNQNDNKNDNNEILTNNYIAHNPIIIQQNKNKEEKEKAKMNSKTKSFNPKKKSNKSEINILTQQNQIQSNDSQQPQSMLPIIDQTQQQQSLSFQSQSSSFPIIHYQTQINPLSQTPIQFNSLNYNQYQQFNPFLQQQMIFPPIYQNNIYPIQYNQQNQQQYPFLQNLLYQQQQQQQNNFSNNNNNLFGQTNMNWNQTLISNQNNQIPSTLGSNTFGGMFGIQTPQYQFDQLHSIIKDIHSIIESKTINDELKVIKIRQIIIELKKKELNELRKIFNIAAFKLIQQYINDCRTGIEKILLDIIKLIAEKVIQIYNIFAPPDPIFNDIKSSGLFDKIEQIIKDKIEEEKEQKKYSDETEQLIRIHIHIMKGRKSDQQIIDINVKVIEKNINNLLNIIYQLKDNKGIKKEQENEETERQIKQSAQLIKVISLIEEKDPVYDWMTRIPDQIMKIVNERICPLIHLNCPPDINCQYCINVPQSPALLELKSYVFQTLNDISMNNQEFKNSLVNDPNIILHLIHLLIQFASQSQLNKKSDSQEQHDQQQTEYLSSLSLIASSLDLLERLISNNNNNICNVVINTQKALHSLITLSVYMIGTHLSQENDQQTLALRSGSIRCLQQIHSSGDASVYTELVNINYTGVLVITISTASGSGEEQDKEIYWGLNYISDFIKCLNQGKNYGTSFPPQHLLARRSDEQLEEKGAIEEIESQINNKGYRDNIKSPANGAKGAILNYFIEQGNRKPDWYNW